MNRLSDIIQNGMLKHIVDDDFDKGAPSDEC